LTRSIERCRSCGDGEIEQFFNLGDQPLANALLKAPGDDDPEYPLELFWCPSCKLAQLGYTVDPEELFSNYIWVTGTSSTAVAYATIFCDYLLERNPQAGEKGYILEVASNDGTFLKPFAVRGRKILGVDPAQNVASKAEASGAPTICGFFGKDLAKKIVTERGAADVVIARNVLPHVADLNDFLAGVRICMRSGGMAVIEMHYGKIIADQLQYDSIYHEHLCYFTVKSVTLALKRFDLEIIDIAPSPISGGSLVLFIAEQGAARLGEVEAYERREEESGVNKLESWKTFAKKSNLHKDKFFSLIEAEKSSGHTVMGYGASARSSTLLNFCGVGCDQLELIADQNRMKHGLFTAGSHILIDTPENMIKNKPDTIVILAWNFLEEITDVLRSRFGYKGRIIAPFPGEPELFINMEALLLSGAKARDNRWSHHKTLETDT